MILGFASLAAVISVVLYATSRNPDALQFKRDHPVVTLLAIVLAGYFLVYVLGSVIVFLYGIAMPLLRKCLRCIIKSEFYFDDRFYSCVHPCVDSTTKFEGED